MKKKLLNTYAMVMNKIKKLVKKNPEEYPLGYHFLVSIKPTYIHKISSRSDIHNSDKFAGGLFYKEISNSYKYDQ